MLIQTTNKDLQSIRQLLYIKQNGLCAICGSTLEGTRTHIDHKHMTSKEVIGENGAGLIRGLCCASCNCMEGKVVNAAKRFGISNLEQWLLNLIEYHKTPPTDYIHPNEKPKEPTVSRRNYNKLKKLCKASNFPEYPKSSKLTKRLSELFEEYKISPYN